MAGERTTITELGTAADLVAGMAAKYRDAGGPTAPFPDGSRGCGDQSTAAGAPRVPSATLSSSAAVVRFPTVEVDHTAYVGWGGVVDDDIARAFQEASDHFVELVARVPRAVYGDAGLGEWSVLELIAHTNRSHTLLVDYVEHPVEPAGEDYNTPEAIAARARASVADLGDDPPAAVAAAARRAQDLVAAAEADTELRSPFGRRRLADYLPIRVAELVIHGLDLAGAVDIEVAPPQQALHVTLHLVADMAERRGAATEVVLALAGRAALADGFSVY